MSKICPYCQKPLWHMQGLRRARHYVKCAASADRSGEADETGAAGLSPKGESAAREAGTPNDSLPPSGANP